MLGQPMLAVSPCSMPALLPRPNLTGLIYDC
ncbi:hypothetical protein DFO48_11520 [Comamonas sp. AG1104]|nr:hypothetical protein DFO48_11520 [Comamonas sp. AG1104]